MASAVLPDPILKQFVVDILEQEHAAFKLKNLKDSNGNTFLHAVAVHGDDQILAALKSTFEEQLSQFVNSLNNDGQAPLHLAVDNGNLVVARSLIELGADTRCKDHAGATPRRLSVSKSHEMWTLLVPDAKELAERFKEIPDDGTVEWFEEIRDDGIASAKLLELMNDGLDISNVLDGKSGLRMAVEAKNKALCEALLDEQDRVATADKEVVLAFDDQNDTDSEGNTLLHAAISGGEFSIAFLLTERREHLIPIANKSGRTPLHFAMSMKRWNYFLLRELRGSVEEQDNEGLTPLHLAVKADILHWGMFWSLNLDTYQKEVRRRIVNIADKSGATPLHIAVKEGKYDIACTLLERFDASVEERDNEGLTPLHLAVKQGHDKLMEKMIEQIAGNRKDEARRMLGVFDNSGMTPLHYAVEKRRFDVARRLVELGANCRQKDFAGKTPLDLLMDAVAADNNDEHLQQFIKFYDENYHLDQLREMLETHDPRRLEDMVKSLLLEDWNLLQGEEGNTLLHIACELGNLPLVKLLLASSQEAKGYLTTRDKSFLGNTPFHAAAIGGNLDIFKALKNEAQDGVEIHMNDFGQTPLHFAILQGHWDLAHYIVSKNYNAGYALDNAGHTLLHFAAKAGFKDYDFKNFWESSDFERFWEGKVNHQSIAGVTALHYAAWNFSVVSWSFREWLMGQDGIAKSLEVADNVLRGRPMEWNLLAPEFWVYGIIRPYGTVPFLAPVELLEWMVTVKVYAEASKGFITSDRLHELCQRLHDLCYGYVDRLERRYWERNQLEPGVISCAAGYGDDYTCRDLARELNEIGVNHRDTVRNALRESRLLEFAALHVGMSSRHLRKDVIKPMMEVMHEYLSAAEVEEQLKAAFRIAFRRGDKVRLDFARSLVIADDDTPEKRIPQSMRHRIVSAGIAATWDSGKLDSLLKKVPSTDIYPVNMNELIDDVPLAFWVVLIEVERKRLDRTPIDEPGARAKKGDDDNIHLMEASVHKQESTASKTKPSKKWLILKWLGGGKKKEQVERSTVTVSIEKAKRWALNLMRLGKNDQHVDSTSRLQAVKNLCWSKQSGTHSAETKQIEEKRIGKQEVQAEKEDPNAKKAKLDRLLQFVKKDMNLRNEDRLNKKGIHTGRTALHWATIFEEKEILALLCNPEDSKDEVIRRDLLDDYGKPAYWYAIGQDNTVVNELKWEDFNESLRKDRDMFVDGINAVLVGAALISSVAFGGFFNPPLSYPDPITPNKAHVKYVAINLPGVKAFWVFNSLSFFFGMASALAGVTGVLPTGDIFNLEVLEKIRKLLVAATILLVFSITFVLLAFGSAGFAVLPPVIKEQAQMIATTSVGGVLCTVFIVVFACAVFRLFPQKWTRLIYAFIGKKSVQMTQKDDLQFPEAKEFFERGTLHKNRRRGFLYNEYTWDDGLWGPKFMVRKEVDTLCETVITVCSFCAGRASTASSSSSSCCCPTKAKTNTASD